MGMTNAEAKPIIVELVEKLKKGLEREPAVNKELADDKLTLEVLEQRKTDGTALPEGCPYETYDEWITQIAKEIKSSESSLGRLGIDKAEIVALEYFIANAQ